MQIEKIIGIECHFSFVGFAQAKHNKFKRVGIEDGVYFADAKTRLVHAIARHESGRRASVQLLLNAFDETGKRVNDFEMRLRLPSTLQQYAAR